MSGDDRDPTAQDAIDAAVAELHIAMRDEQDGIADAQFGIQMAQVHALIAIARALGEVKQELDYIGRVLRYGE